MLEENYTCWYEGQKEEDGKQLKAPNVQEAARKAVDIWRHDHIKELSKDDMPFIVYLKDEEGDIHRVSIKTGHA